MAYQYNGKERDVEPLYPHRPYVRRPLPGNELLHQAAAEAYPNDTRLHVKNRPPRAGDQFTQTQSPTGKRMLQSTAEKLDQIARLIPTGATRAQILGDVGWDDVKFRRACQRHGMDNLWEAMPDSGRRRGPIPGVKRGPYPGRRGPRGPHAATIARLDDMAELLQDPHCSKEEALTRSGYLNFAAFSKAAYRTGRSHLIRMYHEHGQHVDPVHLVHAGRLASGMDHIPNGRRMANV